MIKIIFALLISSTLQAQEKWYKITGNDIGIISCQFIAGTADAYNQNILFNGFRRGDKFWDNKISWKNKYKNYDAGDKRPAFFGSTTFLVAVTDGYHFTRGVDRTFTAATIGLVAGELKKFEKKHRWKVVAKKIVLSFIANRIAFNVFYGAKQK